MPADKPKSGSPPAPSFYSAAAGMDGKKPEPGSSTPAGQQGEKVKQIETLLEVFAKLDKQETDPDGKAMIQSMVDQAKKYLDKIKGVSTKPGPAAAPATGEAGSGGMATEPPMAGGAGAGVGAPGAMA
ncbi:MAG TPA: hypothetical protein VJX30_03025 [Terriglobales bacterium]|nr:hypothetical protein [Terriglobales bacterium]